jgi:hypothetical protein
MPYKLPIAIISSVYFIWIQTDEQIANSVLPFSNFKICIKP